MTKKPYQAGRLKEAVDRTLEAKDMMAYPSDLQRLETDALTSPGARRFMNRFKRLQGLEFY